MSRPRNAGHKAERRAFCRYTVYDNKTDKAVIYDGTASECALAMGRSQNSFCCMVDRVRQGKNRRWTVLQRFCDEEDPEEDVA